MAAMLALSILLAPFAFAHSTITTSRENDRAIKLDLIDRLRNAPDMLILGSSRAKRADPTYLRKLTGHTGFNAGVTGGTAADAWVMTRYMSDCFPDRRLRYLWFVDVGIATDGINRDLLADARSHKYLGTPDSPVRQRRCGPGDHRTNARYEPDGSYTRTAARRLPKQAMDLQEEVVMAVANVRAHRGKGGLSTNPRRLVQFERALAFMNAQGSRPVIVLNPIHPAVLAELRKYGFPARKVAAATFRQLHRRFRFVIVDAEDIRRWGGDPRGFWGVAHIDTANMRRLLPYVVEHSGGALH